MGYTATHLYLYIETDAPEVSYHQRGYLWGDGYKLLLGLPKESTLTNEYYDIGPYNFSAYMIISTTIDNGWEFSSLRTVDHYNIPIYAIL